MILLKKTLEDIMDETLAELEGIGVGAGDVARLLLTIINKKLAEYYEALDTNLMQAFVSTATDSFLDRIGQLMDCERTNGESDDDYRYRITKQLQVVASANSVAIRLAALSVEGVQDVKLKRWTHGTGSFSLYVISEDSYTPQEILDSVQARIDEVESFGVRGEVFRPITIPVEMKIRLVFNKGVTDLDKQLSISKALENVKEYVNSRNVEEQLSINEIKKVISSVNEEINEIILFSFKVNNRPAIVVDQTCAWNERFVESEKLNAIQVM